MRERERERGVSAHVKCVNMCVCVCVCVYTSSIKKSSHKLHWCIKSLFFNFKENL